MSDKYVWLLYVALAGFAWGTYVPIIFYGGSELGPDNPNVPAGANARLMAILCVGGAYFFIGVVLPLILFLTGQYDWPVLRPTGLVFSSLAGVAGAVGAICVIFATQAAVAAARAATPDPLPPATFRVYIAPLIFGLAPVINVLVSTIWHPKRNEPFHFELDLPGWKLWVGILLVGLGAGLVLFSKEEAESHKKSAAAAPAPAPSPEAKS